MNHANIVLSPQIEEYIISYVKLVSDYLSLYRKFRLIVLQIKHTETKKKIQTFTKLIGNVQSKVAKTATKWPKFTKIRKTLWLQVKLLNKSCFLCAGHSCLSVAQIKQTWKCTCLVDGNASLYQLDHHKYALFLNWQAVLWDFC